MVQIIVVILGIIAALYLILCLLVTVQQRKLIYFPSHDPTPTTLHEWRANGQLVGYCREVKNPRNIWLMCHGNGGQASHRAYVLQCLSSRDAFYVLEYPGYGARPGEYTKSSINQAAIEAYRLLRAEYPGVPVCVLGESLGSGPVSVLGTLPDAPDKIVLVVPYDDLANVAAEHFPYLPVRLMLWDRWNNGEALKRYRGKVEIFAAPGDMIIPIHHARNLAKQLPGAVLHEIPGGHNEWPTSGAVMLHNDSVGHGIQ